MTMPLTVPPRRDHWSFLEFPIGSDLDALDAQVAILGRPTTIPTRSKRSPTTTPAPEKSSSPASSSGVRARSMRATPCS